jgi:hypothetical protein
MKNVMTPLRPPIFSSDPLASPAALADAATAFHAPHMLTRGGPYQRSVNLVARGADPHTASVTAAAQGKGHVAELAQSAHYTATAAALGRTVRARPNPVANDPRTDVEVLRRRTRMHGSQLKVGSLGHIRRALRAGRYDHLIINAEAFEAAAGVSGVTDRLDHRGVAAPQLTAADCELTATQALEKMLLEEQSVTHLDALWYAARAGARDGLISFAVGMVGQVSDAVFRRVELDLRVAIGAALGGAARSAARTGLEASMLLQRFVGKARAAFSSRLLQRIARSRLLVSAIAEVVVETAVDLVDVLRGRISFEDLLRRFGVHVATATGGAVGVAAGLALTRGMPWWVSVLAALLGGYGGSKLGRHLGEAAFMPSPLRLPAAR